MSAVLEGRKVALWDYLFMRPLDEVGIELSGKDLETYEKIEGIVKTFCKALSLPESTVVLSTFPSWSNCHNYFFVPTKCFSAETRNRIYQVWTGKSRYPVDDEIKQTIVKMAAIESEIFISQSVEEWSMLIGHELGHAWLNRYFKAFYSQSLQIEGETMPRREHDRAQEKICDFIGVSLYWTKNRIEKIGEAPTRSAG